MTTSPLLRKLLSIAALLLIATAPLSQASQPGVCNNAGSEKLAISPAQAGKIASNKFGGKVIDVRTIQGKQGYIYRVRLLQASGRVITVHVDASSGRIL